MKKLHLIFLILFFSTILFGQNNTKYIPDWNSLDQRETPEWFRDAKLGIFIHWGVYSVPSFNAKGEYAEWYYKYWKEKREPVWDFHKKVYGEDFHYKNFASVNYGRWEGGERPYSFSSNLMIKKRSPSDLHFVKNPLYRGDLGPTMLGGLN